MQHRMKEHQLDKSQIETMLNCIQTGTIATCGTCPFCIFK